jgi:hypothetical protein
MNRHDSDIWTSHLYRFPRDSRDAFGGRFQVEPKNKDYLWAIGSVLLGIAVVLLMVGRMS